MNDINWEADQVASYVSCCYGPEGSDPGDCYTRVGSDEAGEWWVDDGDDTVRVTELGPFASRDEAVEAAERLAADQDESDGGGENAEAMADRLLRERAGESSPRGEWSCYWDTALDDAGPRGRYETQEQAAAAVDLANKELVAANPGSLLCGFEVRRLVDGKWVLPVEDE